MLCCTVRCSQVITPLLRILEKMHGLLLLHRDIKPENIFLTGLGKFKLGDFGLAIRFDKELPFSRSGTLDYMAPEVRNPCKAACTCRILIEKDRSVSALAWSGLSRRPADPTAGQHCLV